MKIIDKKPLKDSLNPGIEFTLEYFIHDRSKIPIYITGFLRSADNKTIISFINEYNFPQAVKNFELQAINNSFHNQQPNSYSIKVFAFLNNKTLNYIQEQKELNKKGDVVLNLEINMRAIHAKTCISRIYLEHENPQKPLDSHSPLKVMYQNDGKDFRPSNKTDMQILSCDSGRTFLEIRDENETFTITIPSSDWINDYCPLFGIGKFFVVEFPIFDKFENANISKEILDKLIDSLKKMEDNFIAGEWNRVIEYSRPFVELLKEEKQNKTIFELFKKNGYTEESIDDLLNCSKNLFNFSSKFIHATDRSKDINPIINASKEDAYMIYAISMAFLNLISKKLQRDC